MPGPPALYGYPMVTIHSGSGRARRRPAGVPCTLVGLHVNLGGVPVPVLVNRGTGNGRARATGGPC